MEINIYLESSVKGARKQDGWWAYVIEARKGGAAATIEGFGRVEQHTAHQAALSALRAALERFNKPSEITVHTDCALVANAINEGWLARWEQNGWTAASGKEIKNKHFWQTVSHSARGHTLKAARGKRHEYSDWMRREMRGREDA